MSKPRKPLHGGRPEIGQLPVDDDVRKELDFHIEMRAQELEDQGWSRDEAVREAERRFGNRAALSRECEDITHSTDRAARRRNRISALGQDLRYAGRVLKRSPGFALVAILTLALGIGANTAIFSLVNGVLLRPLPYADSEGLVAIFEHQPVQGRVMSVAMQNFEDWHAQASAYDGMSAYSVGPETLLGGERPTRIQRAQVTEDFGRVFRLVPLAGRLFAPEDFHGGAEPVAVVTEDFLGATLPAETLGRRVEVGGVGYRVVGVVPSSFDFPAAARVWTPLVDDNTSRSAHNYRVVARLAAGTSRDRLDAELDQIQGRLVEDLPGEDLEFIGSAVQTVGLRDSLAGRARTPLALLLGAAGLVLLIACTNLASTLLARGSTRIRELTVRWVMGAGRGRLARQLLTESVLLAVLGGAVGLALARGVLVLVKRSDATGIPRLAEVGLDPWVLVFTAAVSVATGVVFGLLPALSLTRLDAAAVLRTGDRNNSGGGRSPLWGVLVGAEVALAFVMLSGSVLLIRSFQRVLDADAGFVTDGVMTADIDVSRGKYPELADHARFYDALLSALEANPDIDAAGVVTGVPLSGGVPNGTLELDGDLSKRGEGSYVAASAGAFEVLGVPLVRGRLFDARDGMDDPHVAVVSQAFADQHWPGDDPVGKQVTGGGMDEFWESRDFATVVGVVGDVRYRALTETPEAVVYFPYSQRPGRLVFAATLVVRSATGDAGAAVPSVRKTLSDMDPDIPPRFASMEERMRDSLAQRRFVMSLLGGFAVIALLLAAVGIYGVVSFSVARRTREMGIRMALGAGRPRVRWMVQGQAMGTVVAGTVAGLLGALALGQALGSMLYEVEPTDPLTLVLVSATLLACAWLASMIPAIRSTKVDPMISMRAE